MIEKRFAVVYQKLEDTTNEQDADLRIVFEKVHQESSEIYELTRLA